MNNEEMMEMYKLDEERKKTYVSGFRAGSNYVNRIEKRNTVLESMFQELIGYEKEWLISDSALKKLNKANLIEVIMNQRELLRLLFEKLDADEAEKLKHKVEKFLWPGMKNS